MGGAYLIGHKHTKLQKPLPPLSYLHPGSLALPDSGSKERVAIWDANSELNAKLVYAIDHSNFRCTHAYTHLQEYKSIVTENTETSRLQ